jgi:hypothetical protein
MRITQPGEEPEETTIEPLEWPVVEPEKKPDREPVPVP